MRYARRLLAGCLMAALAVPAAAGDPAGVPPEEALRSAARQVAAGDLAGAGKGLRRLEEDGAPAALQGRLDFLLGAVLLREGRPGDALGRLERAAASLPLLADYALFWQAAARRRAGEFSRAAALLERLLELHPESLFIERAGRDLPRTYLAAGELARAEEAVGRYLGRFPTGPGRAAVWLVLGELFQRTERIPQAEEVFRRIWTELPTAPESRQAQAFLEAIPDARPFSQGERFQRAMTLSREGRHRQAQDELAPFAEDGPRASAARMALGMGAFQLRQYETAARWLGPLAERAAAADRGEALFWLARSLGRSGDAAGFETRMGLVAELTPRSRRAEEALFLLGRAAMDDGEPSRALPPLSRLLREHPKGSWRDEALWLKGWAEFKLGEPSKAILSWERLCREEAGPRLCPQGAYWRGRALESLQQRTEAVRAYRAFLKEYPDSLYYRMRAVERLVGLGEAAPAVRPAIPASTPPAESAAGLHLEKGRLLKALGLEDEATEEYLEQVRARPEDRDALAECCGAFLELKRYDKAIWMGRRLLAPLSAQAGGRFSARRYWECTYPWGYGEFVRPQAEALGLDPYLVMALIREESAFAPRAVSRTGARGLMQLMPQTADRVARAAKLSLGGESGLEAPEVNIRLGTRHVADLLREQEGRVGLTLAAYNAGSQPVQRWLQRFGLRDEDEFIEDIPYAETRNYVKRVLGSRERYAGLYGMGLGAWGREQGTEGGEHGARSAEHGARGGEGREPRDEGRTAPAAAP